MFDGMYIMYVCYVCMRCMYVISCMYKYHKKVFAHKKRAKEHIKVGEMNARNNHYLHSRAKNSPSTVGCLRLCLCMYVTYVDYVCMLYHVCRHIMYVCHTVDVSWYVYDVCMLCMYTQLTV
jgi:hypothetical protein